jgi:hypothetical protein
MPLIGARLDTVHSGTANVRTVGIDTGRQKNERAHMAHWVGSAYRSFSLWFAPSFVSRRQRAGACTTRKCNIERATRVRTDGRAGRSGAAHPACPAERESSGRASRSASAVRRSERRALPFRGAQRGRGACVWQAHAHALTVCCGCAGRTGLWYLYMRIHICTRTCTACVCAIGPAGYSQPRHGRLPHYT